MRRGKGYLVPQGRETRRWRLCRRRRWGRSIRGGRRGVRSRGREVRRGRLAPRCTRPGRRPPADPPGAGEGRQEHARSLAAASPLRSLAILLLRRGWEGLAGTGTVAAALQGGRRRSAPLCLLLWYAFACSLVSLLASSPSVSLAPAGRCCSQVCSRGFNPTPGVVLLVFSFARDFCQFSVSSLPSTRLYYSPLPVE